MMMVIAVGITPTFNTASNANVSMKVNFKVGIGDVTCK
jgi:hypothetical protein